MGLVYVQARLGAPDATRWAGACVAVSAFDRAGAMGINDNWNNWDANERAKERVGSMKRRRRRSTRERDAPGGFQLHAFVHAPLCAAMHRARRCTLVRPAPGSYPCAFQVLGHQHQQSLNYRRAWDKDQQSTDRWVCRSIQFAGGWGGLDCN